MRIEIDITEEVDKAIKKEVERQLDKGGILGFIRTCVNEEFANSGSRKQLQSHENHLRFIKKELDALHAKGEK